MLIHERIQLLRSNHPGLVTNLVFESIENHRNWLLNQSAIRVVPPIDDAD